MNHSIRWARLLLIAACALLLVACGGAAEAPTQVPAASQPTLAPAEATTAPAEATTAPIAEQAPTTEPAPPAPAAGSSACDNSYYPIRQGATWTYSAAGLDKPREHTQTVTKVEGGNAEITLQTGTITVKNPVVCTADGLQFGSLPSITSQNGDLNAQLTTVNSEGVYLPSADKLTPGAQWDSHYVLKGKINVAQQSVDMTEDIKLHSEVVGSEKVTVAAGSFDALKVRQQMTLNIQMANAPANAPPTTLDQFVWFAKDVGMVKSSVNLTGNQELTTELKSYNIP